MHMGVNAIHEPTLLVHRWVLFGRYICTFPQNTHLCAKEMC